MPSLARWMRWHRWLGLLIMLPILFLAITGVLISASDTLGWQRQAVYADWLAARYGIPKHVPEQGFQVKGRWVVRQGYRLMLDERVVAECDDDLRGAAGYQSMIAAVCGERLVLLNLNGERIEVVSGLPEHAQRLGILHLADPDLTEMGERLVLGHATGNLFLEEFSGRWRPLPAPKADAVEWAAMVVLPSALRDTFATSAPVPGISRERVLLDLHSGRLFGRAGVWIINIAGVLMCVLALTGAWTWLTRIRRRYR